MKILIDTGHPAEILFFSHTAKQFEKNVHSVFFVIRAKDCALAIAKNLRLNFVSKGSGSYAIFLKPFYFIRALWVLFVTARSIKPDVFLSFASPYAGVIARLFKKSHIAFLDTEHGKLLRWLDKNFSSHIITPSCFQQELGAKQIKVDTYKEMAYLSPVYFNPNAVIRKELNLPENYMLVRLVNHGNIHDVLKKQWNRKSKLEWIAQLAKKYPVVISSEIKLPAELEPYRLTAPAHLYHQVLAHANLVVGESATVAAESAVLGVPPVYIEYNSRGYVEELEKKYGLINHYLPNTEGLKNAETFIHAAMQNPNSLKYKEKTRQLLSEKTDVTALMVWFVENYPESAQIMKENPDYQYNFK